MGVVVGAAEQAAVLWHCPQLSFHFQLTAPTDNCNQSIPKFLSAEFQLFMSFIAAIIVIYNQGVLSIEWLKSLFHSVLLFCLTYTLRLENLQDEKSARPANPNFL